ncbi:MAG: SDR family NAD(P)-dependent oxidoreductase [Nitrococcus mobilis]|nr:SDR family NAD(P)-dependent oxidoreductase [Nitrococcus mobilis]
MTENRRIAVITGANRGLGFETARQLARRGYKAVLTSRDAVQGKAAADKLQGEALDVGYHPLDVTRADSVQRLAEFLDNAFGRLDALVNNAGIFPERAIAHGARSAPNVFEMPLELLHENLQTNAFGALRLIQTIMPLMRRHGYGRIVNISSGYGQLAHMARGFPAYRMSKAMLNVITCLVAAELEAENIKINSVDPGWVRTRMGGTQATYSPAEAAEWVVEAVTLPDAGPSGVFLKHGQPIEW